MKEGKAKERAEHGELWLDDLLESSAQCVLEPAKGDGAR